MRRWIWWGLAAFGLVLAGLLFTALVLPPASPFAFLEGRRPLDIEAAKEMQRQLEREGLGYEIYSFKADYDAILKVADKELRGRGFDNTRLMYAMGNSRVQAYFNPGLFARPPIPLYSSSRTSMPTESVVIVADRKVLESNGKVTELSPGSHPGWVTVIVRLKPPLSLFDRFRDRIGL